MWMSAPDMRRLYCSLVWMPEDCKRDDVFLNGAEVLQLLVEMAGQQQHGVVELACAAVQGALAKILGHDGRADRDGRDQEYAADDQPAYRVAADRTREVERGASFCRHRSPPKAECRKQLSPPRPVTLVQCRNGSGVRKLS